MELNTFIWAYRLILRETDLDLSQKLFKIKEAAVGLR
jgi:hypothetical protein